MKKKYIFLVVIFLIYFFVVIALSNLGNNDNISGTIVIDSDLCLQYEKHKWKKIFLDDINWKKFNIYNMTTFIGNYFVVNNNKKYYFFDDDNNSIEINSPYIGIQDNSNIKIKNYQSSSDYSNDDSENIKNYLKKKKIKYIGEFSLYKKYIIDINNDQKNDVLYLISNQLYSDNYFYIVFAKINNKYITVNFQDNSKEIINYDLAWMLNSKSNGYNDLIFNYYDFEQLKYDLFIFNSDKKQYDVVDK